MPLGGTQGGNSLCGPPHGAWLAPDRGVTELRWCAPRSVGRDRGDGRNGGRHARMRPRPWTPKECGARRRTKWEDGHAERNWNLHAVSFGYGCRVRCRKPADRRSVRRRRVCRQADPHHQSRGSRRRRRLCTLRSARGAAPGSFHPGQARSRHHIYARRIRAQCNEPSI